jgi:hypothetical protein
MQLNLGFGGISLVECGDLDYSKNYPDEKYFYFKLDAPSRYLSGYYSDYEFTYKYIRYRCSTNYRYIDYSDLYSFIINNLRVYFGEGYTISDSSVTYFKSYLNLDNIDEYEYGKNVLEVIAVGGFGNNYYVIHNIDDLDINLINNFNRYKYNISDYNIKLLNDQINEGKIKNIKIKEIFNKYHKLYNQLVKNLRYEVEEILYEDFYNNNGIRVGDILLDNDGKVVIISKIEYSNFDRYVDKDKIFEYVNKYNIYIRVVLNKGKNIEISDRQERYYIDRFIKNFGNLDLLSLDNKYNISQFYSNCKKIYDEYNNKSDSLYNEEVRYIDNNIKTYLMKNGRSKLYKIGKSSNPSIREKTLQSEDPNNIMVKIWDYNIETLLHNIYKEHRVRGEWFNLTKIQVEYICRNNWLEQ